MKRGHLMTGIVYVAVGILLLALSSLTEGRLGSLLFAFGFAGAVPGAVMIGKYVYWTSPRNRERYAERVEQERIDLQDELNQKLSDRSGRCAYLIGLAVLSVSIVAFSVLDALARTEEAVQAALDEVKQQRVRFRTASAEQMQEQRAKLEQKAIQSDDDV